MDTQYCLSAVSMVSEETDAYCIPVTVTANPEILAIDPSLPLNGDTIEGYRIEELLHIGVMTAVYRATEKHTGKPCVIALCRTHASPAFRRSFELSRNLLAHIDNLAVVRCIGGSCYQNLPFIVRDWIPGKSVGTYLAIAGKFPAEVCLSIILITTTVLAEIADMVEECLWAENFSRCIWWIQPHDIIVSTAGVLHLLTHGISHQFDVRITQQDALAAVRPLRYSPVMDCATILHSAGILLSSMLDGCCFVQSESSGDGNNKLSRELHEAARKCRYEAAGFTSLHKLCATLCELHSRYCDTIAATIVRDYFTGNITGRR